MNILRSIKRLATVVISLVLFLYIVSNSFLYHTHEVDGGKITHSHLYFPNGDDADQSHSHTDEEYLLIEEFNSVALFEIGYVPLLAFLYLLSIYIAKEVSNRSVRQLLFDKGRAPPVLFEVN